MRPNMSIGDMISPFKAVIGASYKAVEARLLAAIHLRFGLPRGDAGRRRAVVKQADRIAAFLEATELAGFSIGEARHFFGDPRPAGAMRLLSLPCRPRRRRRLFSPALPN